MARRRESRLTGLWENLERLPGRPWWWGVGVGLAVLLLAILIFRNASRITGRYVVPIVKSFSEGDDNPPAKPADKKKTDESAKVDASAATEGASQNKPRQLLRRPHHAHSPAHSSSLPAPALLSEWSDNDFLRAHVQYDPRLVAAIEHRARASQRTTEEAEMLFALLKPLPAPKTEGQLRKGQLVPPSPELVRAVTTALSSNASDYARETLAELLAGELSVCQAMPIEQRQAAAECAIVALLQTGSPENERAVLKYFMAPPPTISPETGKTLPTVLGPGEIAAVREHGSARFRIILARDMTEGTMPAARRNAVLALLCEPNPLNLEAQAMLYQSEVVTDPPTAHGLGEAIYCRQHGGDEDFFGLRPIQERRALRQDWQYCVGTKLWGPPLTNFLIVGQQALGHLSDAQTAVALSATIPSDVVRAKLHRTLSRHWSEGPQALRTAGIPGDVLVEPGFITTLKSLAREGRSPLKPGAAKTGRNHNHAQPLPTRPVEDTWAQSGGRLELAGGGRGF